MGSGGDTSRRKASKKDDLRSKNREAQRRFREKQKCAPPCTAHPVDSSMHLAAMRLLLHPPALLMTFGSPCKHNHLEPLARSWVPLTVDEPPRNTAACTHTETPEVRGSS